MTAKSHLNFPLIFMRVVIVVLSLALFDSILAQEALTVPPLTGREPAIAEAIWQLEQRYWQTLDDHDLQAHSALWHSEALGWPSRLPAPGGVEPILAVSQGLLAVIVPQSGEFVIDPETWAITGVNDELALVHYVIRVTATLQDGGEFVLHDRYTHTWVLTDEGYWKILGGNSTPYEAASE
jgi:ketosteroid isomerase-like protein